MAKKMYDDEEKIQSTSEPPKIIQELTKVASDYLNKNYKHAKANLAARIPAAPIDIAKWWVSIERPAKIPYENCTEKTGKNDRIYWNCPYIDWCKYTLSHFLTETTEFQDLIIDQHLNGIHWRGERREVFERIIKENNSYKNNPVEYKKKAFKAMHAFLGMK